MYGAQLSDAIASLFPFDVEIDVELDGEDDLVITVQGATLDIGGTVIQRLREYVVRGEITIPYEFLGEAADEDDARDKAEDAVAEYIDTINPPVGHGIKDLHVFTLDYTLNTVQEA